MKINYIQILIIYVYLSGIKIEYLLIHLTYFAYCYLIVSSNNPIAILTWFDWKLSKNFNHNSNRMKIYIFLLLKTKDNIMINILILSAIKICKQILLVLKLNLIYMWDIVTNWALSANFVQSALSFPRTCERAAGLANCFWGYNCLFEA